MAGPHGVAGLLQDLGAREGAVFSREVGVNDAAAGSRRFSANTVRMPITESTRFCAAPKVARAEITSQGRVQRTMRSAPGCRPAVIMSARGWWRLCQIHRGEADGVVDIGAGAHGR